LETLDTTQSTEGAVDDGAHPTNWDWLDPFPSIGATRIKRHTDVSPDPRYSLLGPTASHYDAECTAAPSRVPPWVLPPEETQAPHDEGHGTSPYLIYARGVPDRPDPGQTYFDKKLCTLILIEIGLSRDIGLDKKHAEKTDKYSPSSRPSSNIGEGWNSSPTLSDTRVHCSQGPSTTSPSHSSRLAQERNTLERTRTHRSPTRTSTPRATTAACSSRR
jgi:hypothetical protein